MDVLALIPDSVEAIYVVDDACPEKSGLHVEQNSLDKRVKVLCNSKNLGVGGAVVTGYKTALEEGCDIMVKIDADGQMDPGQISPFVEAIATGSADYVKGNRFVHLEALKTMPGIRLFGNSCLSLINKFVNGYWDIMDPTNGYTAIHKEALRLLDLDKIDRRYFFESDMLFRLGLNKAVVRDIPLPAIYGNEVSNLSVKKIVFEFPPKYLSRFLKRVFYLYFLRDFNAGTVQLFLGLPLFLFGLIFGLIKWYHSVAYDQIASSGTVMLAALPMILGFQLILGWLYYDIQQVPRNPVSRNKI